MKVYNRLSSFFYSILPWFVPGILFMFTNGIILLSTSSQDIQNSIFVVGFIGRSNIVTTLILPFLFGLLIDYLSSPLFSYLSDKPKLLKELFEKNHRFQNYNESLCNHYEKETLSPNFIINEAKFLFDTDKSELSIYKLSGLYKLMRNLLIPVSYFSFLFLLLVLNMGSEFMFLGLLIIMPCFVGIFCLLLDRSKQLYKKLIEMSFFIVNENIKE